MRWTMIGGWVWALMSARSNDLEKSLDPRNFCPKLGTSSFSVSRVGQRQYDRGSWHGRTRASANWLLERLDQAIRECDAALGPSARGNGHWQQGDHLRGLRPSGLRFRSSRCVNELADGVEAASPLGQGKALNARWRAPG